MNSNERPRLGWSWLSTPLFAAVLGIVVFVDTLLLQLGPLPPSLAPTSPGMNEGWAAAFPAKIDQVTAAVAMLPFTLSPPEEEPQGAGALTWVHRSYSGTMPAPGTLTGLEQIFDPVRSAAPGVVVSVVDSDSGAQARIGIDGLLTHTIALRWLQRRPQLAVIIDDLGNDLRIARELAGLDAPLTFAIMPFRPFTVQVAELAQLFHREVLLHVPMEPDSGEDFGADEILRLAQSDADIRRDLAGMIAAVPHAVGVNNHMGSAFTRNRDRMGSVMGALKEHQLFFVDSRTTPDSVACEVAATLAVPCAGRSVFLDDTDDPAAIRAQLDALLTLLRTRGDAVAIGHPRPATVAALSEALPRFSAASIDIVPASAIVAPPSLSGR